MLPEVKTLIEHYKLVTVPVEETLFLSTYPSYQEFDDGKPCGPAMLALYFDEPRNVSLVHKLTVDEAWHFYGGDPLQLVLLYPDGSSKDVIMGSDPLKGYLVQFVVPAGVWQAGHMVDGGRNSLFECSMAPGYADDMWEGCIRDQLIGDYPDRVNEINMLGCSQSERSMAKGFAS